MTKQEITTDTNTNTDNGQLFEQVTIEDTPFTAIKMGEQWFLTMGKYRLTEPVETLQDCIDAAKDASWWRIMQIVNIMIKEHEEQKMENTKKG